MTAISVAHQDPTPAGRRIGYVIAAALNLVGLWIVNNLLGWGWPPFLTESFRDLLPLIDVSLGASVVINLLWAWSDPPWFKHLAQIGLNLIGLLVTVRTWQIFPFDLSDYAPAWETIARIVIGVGIIGVIIGTVNEVAQFARSDHHPRMTHPHPA